ncbi:hypothetical protein FOCC_FOCC005493 [Frankliniella occidentalis]|nr:hypothetical protein FOCC_FOCC005493 [Frankliniella occidentalis]
MTSRVGDPIDCKGSYACQRCGKRYRHKPTLYTHLRFECGKEPQFKCPHCPQRSKRKTTLHLHIRRMHAQDR